MQTTPEMPRVVSLPLTVDEFHFVMHACTRSIAEGTGDINVAIEAGWHANKWLNRLDNEGVTKVVEKLLVLHKSLCNIED